MDQAEFLGAVVRIVGGCFRVALLKGLCKENQLLEVAF